MNSGQNPPNHTPSTSGFFLCVNNEGKSVADALWLLEPRAICGTTEVIIICRSCFSSSCDVSIAKRPFYQISYNYGLCNHGICLRWVVVDVVSRKISVQANSRALWSSLLLESGALNRMSHKMNRIGGFQLWQPEVFFGCIHLEGLIRSVIWTTLICN